MKAVLEQLVAAFPETKLKPDTLKVYTDKLSDLPADVLDRAAHVCICTQKWFPKISELREAAADIIMQGRGHQTAEAAWATVLGHVKGTCTYMTPLTMSAIGGRDGLCEFRKSESQYEYKYRERFIAAYNALLADERRKVIVG